MHLALGGILAWASFSACARGPSPPASSDFLRSSWEAYRRLYIRPDGYVIDPRRDGGSVTSEGQAYAMLRAVWMEDRATFERLSRWTEANLRRDDGLHAWLWSPDGGGRVVDRHSAADGDQEIAFALLLAADAFGEPEFRGRAVEILRAIREHEWLALPWGPFPAAGDWAVAEAIVNPSYFLPYAYPLFEAADPGGGWREARLAGYELMRRLSEAFSLPPDFVRVDDSGRVRPLEPGHPLSGDFSFDAVRIYWRLAVDCPSTARGADCPPGPGFDVLVSELREHGRIVDRYRPDGTPLSETESLSFYGALLPGLARHDPELAAAIRESRLDGGSLEALVSQPDRYYDANWVWFGLAAADGWLADRIPRPPAAPGLPRSDRRGRAVRGS